MSTKTDPRSGLYSVAVLIAAVALAAMGGLMYVHSKNCQYLVDRRIERVQSRIEKHRDEIRTMHMEMDRRLNCFLIAEKLEHGGSGLRVIPPEAVEVIPSANRSDPSIASNQP